MSRNKGDHYRRTIEPVTGGTGSGEVATVIIEDGEVTEIVRSLGHETLEAVIIESPIEEKIHALVDAQPSQPIQGWENDMKEAPIDGSRVMVSATGKDQGVLVYWRISKFVDKKNLRYIPRGRWTDFLSKVDIAFVPKYWKAYDPEQYWPLQGGTV